MFLDVRRTYASSVTCTFGLVTDSTSKLEAKNWSVSDKDKNMLRHKSK